MAKKLSPELILAYTLLGEAADEGPEGMAAVAHVLRNRGGETITQMARTALVPKQFSFWNRGKEKVIGWINRNTTHEEQAAALAIAKAVSSGALPDPTGGALHYYANAGANAIAQPGWFGAAAKAGGVQIGNHIFAARVTPETTIAAYKPALSAAIAGVPIPKTMSAETRMARYMEAGKRLAEPQGMEFPYRYAPVLKNNSAGQTVNSNFERAIAAVPETSVQSPAMRGGLITRVVQTTPVRSPLITKMAPSSILKGTGPQLDTMIDLMSTEKFWNPTEQTAVVQKKPLLAEQLGVKPLDVSAGANVARLTRPDPPLPRERPATPAGAKSKFATTKTGKQVEIGKGYRVGGVDYVGAVDENGVGRLDRVPWNPLQEADAPTIVGGIVRHEIKKGVDEAKIKAQEAAPMIVKSATGTVVDTVTGIAGNVGGFFGDLFGGGAKQGAAAPRPAIQVLQDIHDRKEGTVPVKSSPSPSKASWLPYPDAIPKPVTTSRPVAPPPPKPTASVLRSGAAAVKTISKTISVPKQIKVENPEWGKVSPAAIAKLQDIHDKEDARRIAAQTPQFITKTVMEQRTIEVPVKQGAIAQPIVAPQGASAPAAQQPSVTQTVTAQVPLMTAVQRLQSQGLSPSDAYAEANRQERERAQKKAGIGTTSSGQSKVTRTGESWASAFGSS